MVLKDIMEVLDSGVRNKGSKYAEFIKICEESKEGILRLSGGYNEVITVYNGIRKYIQKHSPHISVFKSRDGENSNIHYVYLVTEIAYSELVNKGIIKE